MNKSVLRWLVAAAFVFAAAVSGLFSGLEDGAGLLYLVFGSVAVALMGFSLSEIGAAFRAAAGRGGPEADLGRASYFWEAAARNAWILGALGSAMNFTLALGVPSDGIANTGARMVQAFVVTLYGFILAVLCLVPSVKLSAMAEKEGPGSGGPAAPRPAGRAVVERAVGYVLFAAVTGLTIFASVGGRPQEGPLPIAKIMLNGPAILVVFGGAIALALFMGAGAGARALTLGFSVTGLVILLMGLIQALFGFARTDIKGLSTAIAFIISGSMFALLGLAAIAAPLEDREVMAGKRDRPGHLSRMFWTVFPLVTFLFLILTFIMVITPMKVPGGK